jgi:dTMP kinase
MARHSTSSDDRRHDGPGDLNVSGYLIAFEGLDQSGKQTQAELLRDRLKQEGHKSRLVSFPDYGTSIGEELARALQGERDYDADVMQLLYVANRYERKPDLDRWLEGGLILVCDRYTGSSIAYGEALGLDPAWLVEMQRFLPTAALTIVLDIAPATAVARKAVDRDRYERDLALQARVRQSYQRQAAAERWLVLDGERSKDAIAEDVFQEVNARVLARP